MRFRARGAAAVLLAALSCPRGAAAGVAVPHRADADHAPAGLTREDWSQIRSAVRAPASFLHEAQLFGHGEPVGEQGAEFGYSVAVSGDTLVVGTPFSSSPLFSAGAAEVFVRSGNTWTRQQRLTASDAAAYDRFGWSVSVSGDTLVVGATGGYPTTTIPGWAYVFVRTGSTWTQQQKLIASDGAANDYFGAAVSVSGDTVVVGAYLDDTAAGADAGSSYVFVRTGSTWTEQQKLLASDGAAGDWFGYSVSASGDTAVAGAARHDAPGGGDAGSAYVFVRSGTTWAEQQELTASAGAASDSFGSSVSVSGDTLVAGAPGIFPATTPGGAYVFVRSGTTWTEQQKLLASDGLPDDEFGTSVSVFQDTVVVGAALDDTAAGIYAGSAYVYVRSGATWTEQQKLTPSTPAAVDFFGSSVSISGDTVAAGAPNGDAPGGPDAGAAYVFVRAGTAWTEQQKLLASAGTAFDDFGWSAALSGDTAVVGAPQDSVSAGLRAGSAYVFVRTGTTWTLQQKLVASDGAPEDFFGYSVAISGEFAVVSSRYDDTAAGTNAGSAYVFKRSNGAWTEQQKLTAPDGAAFDVFGSSVSVSGDTIVAGAPEEAPPGAFSVGSAYVFVRSGTAWTHQQKLLASDGANFDVFGTSVAISGDTVVVGAPFDTGYGWGYVFVRAGTTWTQQQKLIVGGVVDRFLGRSVAVSGDTALLGAPSDDTAAGAQAGSAYVFVRAGTTWTQQQKLVASDGAPGDGLGWSVSVSGDTAAVGAPFDDMSGPTDVGSAHVFLRTGTVWSEEPTLLAPDGEGGDIFGYSVAVAGDTVVVGAYADDTQDGQDSGSAHVFRLAHADLGVTKTDGQATATPGQPITYAIVVSNAGPTAAPAATVTDAAPAILLGAAWTCTASAGSTCTASGSGSINDTVGLLPGGTATYVLTGTVDPAATGSLANTATAADPNDPNLSNNSATDIDALTPETDLAITKTDSADPVNPGDPLTYTLGFTNDGPSNATGVSVVDALPAGVTFVSSVPGAPTCTLAAAILTCAMGNLAAGSPGTVTVNVTVDAGASGMLVNTATVSGNETDPVTTNNTASAVTAIGPRDGELSHGTDELYDLAALPGPVADEDVFRIDQKPYSSYEVVVDATSGDIGAGSGPLLQRLGPDGTTVLQDSLPIGVGPSRSLRWRNTSASAVESETIRVRSAGCGTDCGPDDVYRIRAYETTCSVPRFNNAGTQVTVLILQNPTSHPIAGEVYFQVSAGTLVATEAFSLGAKATLVLNSAGIPGANGVSGAITVAHDGGYGELAGKTVALEPATGFSFDSPLLPRPR